MESTLFFEICGAVFSMLGAWYMSKGFQDKSNAVKTFAFYLISNVFLVNLAISGMLIPLLVQVVFFTVTSLSGLKAFAPEKMRTVYALFTISLIGTIFHLVSSLGKDPIVEITGLEVLAAVAAISGSFILKAQDASKRLYAFYLFLLADSIYIAIGIDNGFYFFALQAAYFLYTVMV